MIRINGNKNVLRVDRGRGREEVFPWAPEREMKGGRRRKREELRTLQIMFECREQTRRKKTRERTELALRAS